MNYNKRDNLETDHNQKPLQSEIPEMKLELKIFEEGVRRLKKEGHDLRKESDADFDRGDVDLGRLHLSESRSIMSDYWKVFVKAFALKEKLRSLKS